MRSLVVFFCLMLTLAAWSQPTPTPPRPSNKSLVVGSKAFTEGRILAEMMALVLEDAGYTVQRRLGLGGTMICFSALERGQIDMYPEYTGTGWTTVLAESTPLRDPLQAFLTVRREFRKRHQMEWLSPFGFSNTYALAMPESRAKELNIERLSQVAEHQSQLRVGMSHEFLNRSDGYAGLAKAYGLEFPDLRGMEHTLAYQGVANRQIDLIDAYSTDAKLLRYKLRVLEDDRDFFPPYQAAPVVRQQVLTEHPEVSGILERLAFLIDARKMTELNFEVEEKGRGFKAVAEEFLRSKNLIGGRQSKSPEQNRKQGLAQLFWARRQATLQLAWQHLQLTFLSVVLAALVAVPVGVLIHRRPGLAGPVLGLAGMLQTVPSIALLACLITVPGLGLGPRSAVVALFLYALLPILRNTYTGLVQIEPQLREAAVGQGLTDLQLLWHLELPLALPTIFAGLRTSAVINVGVATLAAFVGAGGLGDPIVTGLQLNDTGLILTGAVPAALLALIVDGLLAALGVRLTPRGLRP